jgi:uncharacterized membrane protein
MKLSVVSTPEARRRLHVIRLTLGLARHWLLIFIFTFGILNVLPFMAPAAMRLGWTNVGNAIYTFYSPLCHQMAQRSFFLFGSQAMYNLDELPLNLTGNKVTDILLLRELRGNQDLGWKAAWSDRMVAMYGGLWLASAAYSLLTRNRRFKPISVWMFMLLMLPITIDGITHMLSDLSGLTSEFRYGNEWLAALTAHSLPESFYRGDAFGSFNSWMRLTSGVLFGIGIGAFGLPIIDRESRIIVRILGDKLTRYDDQHRSVSG